MANSCDGLGMVPVVPGTSLITGAGGGGGGGGATPSPLRTSGWWPHEPTNYPARMRKRSSVVAQKTARSEDSGITVVGKYNQIVGSGENLLLNARHSPRALKIVRLDRPHLAIPRVDSTARARAQYR